MTRTKLAERQLPSYTRGEEIFNMVSHIVGGAFGVISLIVCITMAIIRNNPYSLGGGIVFGLSMILLYTMSSLYHGLVHIMAKKVFQVIDHCSVYILIAGTYTPILLNVIIPASPAAGIFWLTFVWLLAAVGITLKAVDLNRFKTTSFVIYLLMGWSIIFAVPSLIKSVGSFGGVIGLRGPVAFALLLGGGIVYTIGFVFFCIGSKKRYIHSVFHLFVLLGSILQFLYIAIYVM